MPASDIVIKGAREHNLRSVDVPLPRNQLICLTGVSGSGKSSLAFDTLYAEGQRRYVESLSTLRPAVPGADAQARRRPHQRPVSPSISISQKSSRQQSALDRRHDHRDLRLPPRALRPRRPGPLPAVRPADHGPDAASRSSPASRRCRPGRKFAVLAPLIRGQKGEYKDLFEDLLKQGFVRARVDGRVVQLTDDLSLDRQMRHNIEVVIDRLIAGPDVRGRLAEAVELALEHRRRQHDRRRPRRRRHEEDSERAAASSPPMRDRREPTGRRTAPAIARTKRRAAGTPTRRHRPLVATTPAPHCGLSFEPPTPQLFSFNSPQGMCLTCDGLGEMFSFDPANCSSPTRRSRSSTAASS